MAAIESLEMFEQVNRAQYEAKFGEQAPPFDVTRPDKLWCDNSEKAGNYMRISRDETGKPSLVPMTMSRELAAGVNIPGAYRWQQYTPAPTQAAAQIRDDQNRVIATVPVQAADLSTQDEARAIALEVGGAYTGNSGWLAISVDWPSDEQRRLWLVNVGSLAYHAGQLLRMKYVNGIGAPGKWVNDAIGLRWEPTAQITAQLDPKVKPVPVPCRQLDPEEEFYQQPMGVWAIRKKVAASGDSEIIRLLKLMLNALRIAY